MLVSFCKVRFDDSRINALASLVVAGAMFAALAVGARSDLRCALSSLLFLGLLSAINLGRWRKLAFDKEIATAYADLAVSESAFRSLAESTGDIIVRLSVPDLVHVYVSPACSGILGLSPGDLLNRTLVEKVHPEDRVVLEQIRLALADGRPAALPPFVAYRVLHGAGHWIWVEATISLARGKHDVVDGMIWSIRDIDGRKRIEAARAASEARFRLLAENASEMIVLGFEDGRRSYISSA